MSVVYGKVTRFARRFRTKHDDDDSEIVSKKSLQTFLTAIEYLQLRKAMWTESMFRRYGRQSIRERLLRCLRRGQKFPVRDDILIECAAALREFVSTLRVPLIPVYVQQIILAENTGVPVSVVAADALGLMNVELSGTHRTILIAMLSLLHEARARSPGSELYSSPLAMVLFPYLLKIQSVHAKRWDKIAACIDEIIAMTPQFFGNNNEHNGTVARLAATTTNSSHYYNPHTYQWAGGDNTLPAARIFSQLLNHGELHPVLRQENNH